MRRFLAIALLLVFGLSVAAPVLAAQGEASRIPACCRRNGAHQCAAMSRAATSTPTLRATCTAFPRPASVAPDGVCSVTSSSNSETELASFPFRLGQVEAGYRISGGRSSQKRGPPSLLA